MCAYSCVPSLPGSSGVHPAPKAQEIFVEKYWTHLTTDPVSRAWILAPGK